MNLEYTANGARHVIPAACSQTNFGDLGNYQMISTTTLPPQIAKILNGLSRTLGSRNFLGVNPAMLPRTTTPSSIVAGIVDPQEETQGTTLPPEIAQMLNGSPAPIASENILDVNPAMFFGTTIPGSYGAGIVDPQQTQLTTLPPQIAQMQNDSPTSIASENILDVNPEMFFGTTIAGSYVVGIVDPQEEAQVTTLSSRIVHMQNGSPTLLV